MARASLEPGLRFTAAPVSVVGPPSTPGRVPGIY